MTVQRKRQLPALRLLRAPIAALAFTVVGGYGHRAGAAGDCDALSTNALDPELCAVALPDLNFNAPIDAPRPRADAPAPARFPEGDQPAPSPLAIKPGDHGVSARVGLGTLRDYNASLARRKIDNAKAWGPSTLIVPAAPPPKSSLDVWSKLDAQGVDEGPNRSVRAGVGVDYNLSKGTTVGVAAEQGEASANATQTTQDEKVGAYLAFKSLPNVTVDTRTEWSKSGTVANSAAVTGQAPAEKSSISVAPRLNHSFALDGKKTIEPFVGVKREIDLESAGAAQGQLKTVDSASAGVTLAKPDGYSLSVTTGVEGVGGTDPANVKSELKLKLPLQ